MRYTIGLQIVDNDKTKTSGIYVIGKYGFPYILRFEDGHKVPQEIEECDTIYVFSDSATVSEKISEFSKLYRAEFRSRAKRLGVPVSEFHFFPVKIDSMKFSRKFVLLEKTKYSQRMKADMYRINFANMCDREGATLEG